MDPTVVSRAPLDRRSFLRRTAGLGLGIAFTGDLEALAGIPSSAAATRETVGYGPLAADPAGLLALPSGFSYTVVAETGRTLLETGQPTPSDPDGAAGFRTATGTTLVVNHEIGSDEPHGVPPLAGLTYDPAARGGTTSLDVDALGIRRREYVSVAGTHNNCAGGLTPWGTWITCEETEARAGSQSRVEPVTGQPVLLQKDHGYCFEVSPVQSENLQRSPVPLRFLGRFAHEALAVDPATRVVYETEDAGGPNGLFYRWVPPAGFSGGRFALGSLPDGAGTLSAMSCRSGGVHVRDLSQATRAGTSYSVTWVPVPDRLATSTSVRKQFGVNGVPKATRSRKLEGAWWGHGGCYFASSFARLGDGSAAAHDGQVWFFDPAAQTVTLKTIFTVTSDGVDTDGPDNICVSPYGGVLLAEDGGGKQHLVGVTADGEDYVLARNDHSGGEFAGPHFSPDNATLFANVQSPGHVFAIRGPWQTRTGPRKRPPP